MENRILELLNEKEYIVIAIDGMSASGKTTYANTLASKFDASIIHMDDFFLPLNLRSEKRQNTPGGNIHYERFKEEVISHLKEDISYHKFDCNTGEFSPLIPVEKKRILIIEGAYALHPYFGHYYDISIFMRIDKERQRKRILERNPLTAEKFFSVWIPLEENYFEAFDIAATCNFTLNQ